MGRIQKRKRLENLIAAPSMRDHLTSMEARIQSLSGSSGRAFRLQEIARFARLHGDLIKE